jgi:hypothetical protein
MDLHIHFPIRLHGIVLNQLSTRTALPLGPLLAGEPEGQGSLLRPKRRWDDNIKKVLSEEHGRFGTGFY